MTKYLDLSIAYDRVKALTDREEIDIKEQYYYELLENSAGKKASEIHFRPFYVSALVLLQDLDLQALSEADKVKFTLQMNPIKSFLELQKAYDASNDLEIPPGYTAQELLDSIIDGSVNLMSVFTV